MDAKGAVARLELNPTKREAVRVLSEVSDGRGLAEEFFSRVVALSGENPPAAIRLAARWSEVGEASREVGLTLRTRAVAERLKGQWAQSAESFQEAGRTAGRPVERLSFQSGAVDSLARTGRISEAVKLGHKLSRGLDKLGEGALSARVRLNVGNALVWADEYGKAQKWLQKAIPELDRADFPIEAAAARLALSSAALFGHRPLTAKELAEQAQRFFDREGLTYFSDLCAINLAHDALLRGRADEALLMLLDLKQSLEISPIDKARVEEYIGDAYLKLNMYEEALGSYESAIRLQGQRETALARANCEYGKGQALFLQGNSASAARCFASAARRYLRLENPVWSATAGVGLAKARRQQGNLREAQATLASSVDSLRRSKSWTHLIDALLEAARVALPSGGNQADLVVKEADSLIRRHGYVSRQWEVHWLRAQASSGRREIGLHRRAVAEVLSSRLLTRSDIGRTRFLRDKSEVIESYVRLLLQKPTAPRVREALSTISNSRAVALIDEILNSGSIILSNRDEAEFQRLREELNSFEPENGPSGSEMVRRSTVGVRDVSRKWVELTMSLLQCVQKKEGEDLCSTSVYAQAGPQLFHVFNGKSRRLSHTVESLDQKLKWLEFEMMAPLLEPDAAWEPLLNEIECLGNELGPSSTVAPDGVLWRVPWQAISHLRDGTETTLLASPSFGGSAGLKKLPREPKIGIWYLEGEQLPHVVQEAKLIQSLFPNADVCTTASEVRERLRGAEYDLLHVAGHAGLDVENPMFSFLEFNDGVVYAAEVAKSRLRSRFVVLSACETGSISFTCKEEPEGLIRSFLARGAEAVLAATWSINDESALRFMGPFYAALCDGWSISDAASEGRRTCRSWRPHPFYWAPFVLFGGYSA